MDFLPGVAQATVRTLIVYPFDYMKVHLQNNRYRGMTQFLRENPNIFKLYRGVGIPWVFVSVERGIQYRLFEYFNTFLNPFGSGILCGCLSNLYQIPMQKLQNTYIMDSSQHRIFPFVRDLYRTKGIWGFYEGAQMELLRVPLSTAMFLGIYGNLRTWLGASTLSYVTAASTAGFVLWSVIFPLDLLRTVIQTTNATSYWTVMKTRVRQFGIHNLWKGIVPVYLRTIPAYTLSMVVYEWVRHRLHLEQ